MEHRWPYYEIADDAVVFALGVVSINYNRFERTRIWMLSAVANISEEQASIFGARSNASDRIKTMDSFLAKGEWPSDALAGIKHHLKAMDVLVKNRNVLVHSNIIRGLAV